MEGDIDLTADPRRIGGGGEVSGIVRLPGLPIKSPMFMKNFVAPDALKERLMSASYWRFPCPECGQVVKFGPDKLGKQGRCACGTVLQMTRTGLLPPQPPDSPAPAPSRRSPMWGLVLVAAAVLLYFALAPTPAPVPATFLPVAMELPPPVHGEPVPAPAIPATVPASPDRPVAEPAAAPKAQIPTTAPPAPPAEPPRQDPGEDISHHEDDPRAGEGSKDIARLRQEAEQGDPKAQAELGSAYMMGNGVDKNPAYAVHWFQKAADQGNVTAMTWLGTSYLAGDDVPKDSRRAVEYLRKAAEQGGTMAQFTLGQMYRYGEGVPRDLGQARHWYRLAAQKGYADARDALKSLDDSPQGGSLQKAPPGLIPTAGSYLARKVFSFYRNRSSQGSPE